MEYLNEILLAVLIASQLADGWSTLQALKNGAGAEANPLIAALMDKMGTRSALWVTKLAMVGIAVFLYSIGDTAWLAILCAVYVAAVLNNINALRKKGLL